MASIPINSTGVAKIDITSTGRGPSRAPGDASTGENAPSGVKYTAILVQRPLESQLGVDKYPSRPGSGTVPDSVPVVDMAMRHTGRIGG